MYWTYGMDRRRVDCAARAASEVLWTFLSSFFFLSLKNSCHPHFKCAIQKMNFDLGIEFFLALSRPFLRTVCGCWQTNVPSVSLARTREWASLWLRAASARTLRTQDRITTCEILFSFATEKKIIVYMSKVCIRCRGLVFYFISHLWL